MTGFLKGLYTDFELKSDNVKVGMGLPYLFSVLCNLPQGSFGLLCVQHHGPVVVFVKKL